MHQMRTRPISNAHALRDVYILKSQHLQPCQNQLCLTCAGKIMSEDGANLNRNIVSDGIACLLLEVTSQSHQMQFILSDGFNVAESAETP